MNVDELPPSTSLVTSADQDEIARALQTILGRGPCFYYAGTVRGATRSGRLLNEMGGTESTLTGLREPLTPAEVAEELKKGVCLEVRRPSPPPRPSSVKGWEVRKLLLGQYPAALIWAVWIG